ALDPPGVGHSGILTAGRRGFRPLDVGLTIPPMGSPPLEYAHRVSNDGWSVFGAILPFVALAASIAVAIFSFSRMDGERLVWEGGVQYFLDRCPFAMVLGLAALGAISGIAYLVVIARRRGIAVLAVACNVLWAAWWAWHLFR